MQKSRVIFSQYIQTSGRGSWSCARTDCCFGSALVPIVDITQEESLKSSRVSELEMENRKYKTELEEFRKEFQEIKNQEVTIRRLEDKIAEYEQRVWLPWEILTNQMEQIVEERMKNNDSSMKEELLKTIELMKERSEICEFEVNDT